MQKNRNFFLGKEISSLRIAVTTRCILRCRYCFVKKNNKVMRYRSAARAIELLLESGGRDKMISFYGGEPLLCFDLLKELIILIRRRERELGKKAAVSVATNGILLTDEKIAFFKDSGTKIALSIDGPKATHDRARLFINGKGSFSVVKERACAAIKKLDKADISALFGVLPQSAKYMHKNLSYLNTLGFDTINIEPVQGLRYRWGDRERNAFSSQLQFFIKRIYEGISSKKFIFLSSINRQLQGGRLTDPKRKCPFFNNLEIYPDGEIIFSPLLFNLANNGGYAVGNINSRLSAKFGSCVYDPHAFDCEHCWERYYKDDNFLARISGIVRLRDEYCLEAAELISAVAKNNHLFKNYVAEAKKRVFE
ncbi:MAG: radical SAM protein [Candidatus Omnitrophota bacterium]|nr:radical SAM protein [Candidatus Omnitrophota bacterium]